MILELELLDDVAVTAQNATIDAHETLTYIPGQCLLGATVARAGYDQHGPEGAWNLFHAGAVRFGVGLPCVDGEVAWPVPLSWHRVKGGGIAVVNLAQEGARQHDAQYTQLREGYVTRSGRLVEPTQDRTMRTAIGQEGRARDGFLYTMSALSRGQRFVSEITADDPAHLATVRAALDGQTLRVGRSKRNEFGAVTARVRDDLVVHPSESAFHAASAVLVWCLSDVCLRDPDTAQPTFLPDARAHFGLPEGWSFCPERSFLRTRRYSTFNARRRRPDLERQVIVAGSVLCFRGERALSAEQWSAASARAQRGVGDHRAEGLGRLAFAPELLSRAEPVILARADATPNDAPPPVDPLISWVAEQHSERAARDGAWAQMQSMLGTLSTRPRWSLPASQWGEVRRLARLNRGLDAAALADKLDAFVIATGPQRGVRALHARWGATHQGATLAQWLVQQVRSVRGASPVPGITLEMLSIFAVRQQRAARGGGR